MSSPDRVILIAARRLDPRSIREKLGCNLPGWAARHPSRKRRGLGRQAIFTLTGSLAQTVNAQGPVINVNGLTIGLTLAFVSVIDNAFGPGTFTAGTSVGAVSGYAVLLPLTTPLN